jgi:hypothetical protein
MTEKPESLSIEEQIKTVDAWANRFEDRKLVPDLDRALLRDVLISFGASSEISPGLLKDLSKDNCTNASRAKVMKAVWGERYKDFKRWTGEFIQEHEQRTGKMLPKLGKSGRGNAGMIAFLGDLTAYGLGSDESFPFATFFVRLSERALNGYIREKGIKEKEYRFHLLVPGFNVIKYGFIDDLGALTEGIDLKGALPFSPAGFPSGFIPAAWEKIKTWRK